MSRTDNLYLVKPVPINGTLTLYDLIDLISDGQRITLAQVVTRNSSLHQNNEETVSSGPVYNWLRRAVANPEKFRDGDRAQVDQRERVKARKRTREGTRQGGSLRHRNPNPAPLAIPIIS